MCGIVAAVSDERDVNAGALRAAVASMRHRGPDEASVWRASDGSGGLGHARLSIIDLTTGQQPIANEDETLHIAVNGEFYDFERIRGELEARGHRFRTRSDSEIALHLYEERGVDCFTELRGEFAFAVWDGRKRRMLAARDRFGIKPLFYARCGATLWIASEVKALAAAGVRLEWDRAAVYDSLFSNLSPERTLFAGVRQVPPGCYLEVADGGEVKIAAYWKTDYPKTGEEASRTEADWIERLRAEAAEAVRLRLRADVPVGCLLSGGLDSSAALGMARTFFGGQMKAFTIAFDHPDFDESAVAEASAAAAGVEFFRIRVTNADFARVFEDAVAQGESIQYNAHGAARYLLSRGVREAGVKVVLAGEGADEIAAGYRFFDRALGIGGAMAPAAWPEALVRALKMDTAPAAEVAAALAARAQALAFPSASAAAVAGRRALEHGVVSAEFVREQAGRNPLWEFYRQMDVAEQMDGRAPVRQVMHLWMKSGFANYVLAGERLDMAHAVEQRLPFLDHKLFEVAREVPVELLRRDGQEKWVLREAMRPFVTEQVYRRKKQPFLAPPTLLQDGSAMLKFAEEKLCGGALAATGFFDVGAVETLLARMKTMSGAERGPLDPAVLMMCSLAVLQERYGL